MIEFLSLNLEAENSILEAGARLEARFGRLGEGGSHATHSGEQRQSGVGVPKIKNREPIPEPETETELEPETETELEPETELELEARKLEM